MSPLCRRRFPAFCIRASEPIRKDVTRLATIKQPADKIALITDSASDLTPEQRKQYGIFSVPLRIVYKSGEYRDGIEISPSEVYARMPGEVPSTSLPLPDDVCELYDRLADEGYTRAVHICISSGLSGTYNMVRLLGAEHSRLAVTVVDSKVLSMGEGMLVLECAKTLQETGSIPLAVERLRQIRKGMLGAFIIRTLEYLRKGGRIGLVESVLGSMLNLKPVIFVNDDGVYQTLAKARGFNSARTTLLEEFRRRYGERPVHISVVHGQAQEEAERLLEAAKSTLNAVSGFVAQVSPVLGAHTGPSLLGLIAYEA